MAQSQRRRESVGKCIYVENEKDFMDKTREGLRSKIAAGVRVRHTFGYLKINNYNEEKANIDKKLTGSVC